MSYVAESGLKDVLQGDRLARHAPAVKNRMLDQVFWLSGLSQGVWDRLAVLEGQGSMSIDLFNDVLHGSHVSMAYAEEKVLKAIEDWPWKLVISGGHRGEH